MTGLDTNVLVRYLVQDDPAQSAEATRRIEAGADGSESFAIAPIVLCELVWVLETAYGCPRADIAATLENILRTAQFEVLAKDLVWRAWSDYKTGKGDFSDYYLGAKHRQAGAGKTLTFDKALRTSQLFEWMDVR